MFITTNNKIGFIHIPKCGGTSIYDTFRGGERGPNKRNREDPWSPWPIYDAHSTYKEFKKASKLPSPDTWFTIVRHPCQRFHSWYYYQIAWDKKRLSGELPKKGLDKKTLAYRIKTLEDLGIKGTLFNLDKIKQDTKIKLARHIEHPMYHWIEDCSNLKIFRLEKIKALYNWLDKIGCKVLFTHSKKTPRVTTWEDEFDNEMLEVIQERYAKDFSKFGYKIK